MSPVVGVVILILIAAALLCAALYALFGKPSSRVGKRRKQEVVSGFELAGGILLGFVLMGTLVAFAGVLLGVAPSPRVSRLLAAILALLALAAITLTVQRWAKYFPGFIAWGVVNSLAMAVSGHLLNYPAIPVRRWYALIMVAQCQVTVLVSMRFARKAYKLNIADKLALVAWLLTFCLGLNEERFSIPAITVGNLALVFAWQLHRSKPHRRQR